MSGVAFLYPDGPNFAALLLRRAGALREVLSNVAAVNLSTSADRSFTPIHLTPSPHLGERVDELAGSIMALRDWEKAPCRQDMIAANVMQWFHLVSQLDNRIDHKQRADIGEAAIALFGALRQAAPEGDFIIYTAAAALTAVLPPVHPFFENHIGDLAIGHLALGHMMKLIPFDPRLPQWFADHWCAVQQHQIDVSMESLLSHWYQAAKKIQPQDASAMVVNVMRSLVATEQSDGYDAQTATMRIGALLTRDKLESTRLARSVLAELAKR